MIQENGQTIKQNGASVNYFWTRGDENLLMMAIVNNNIEIINY